jgi:ubiquinone biosynthesis protein Coq4
MKTITLPFKNFREKLIETFFDVSVKPYQWLKQKDESWHVNRQSLMQMPDGTLGQDLGYFLQRNNFELLDKGESHDVYHVLLGYDTTVADEIKLQYFLLGNGRLSFIGYAIMAVGFHLLPEYFREYIKAFRQGRQCKNIIHWDMKNLLSKNTEILRGRLNRPRLPYYEFNYLKPVFR